MVSGTNLQLEKKFQRITCFVS